MERLVTVEPAAAAILRDTDPGLLIKSSLMAERKPVRYWSTWPERAAPHTRLAPASELAVSVRTA